MKINILLPYKEKFDLNKASSVSITVRNNLNYTRFLKEIKVYGQNVKNPFFKDNFIGIDYNLLSFKSKNRFLADKMSYLISKSSEKKQLLEIHNRPYLINQILKKNNLPVSIFFHNDPQTMKGSKLVKDREDILEKCAAVFCVSKYIKKKFLEGITLNSNKVKVLYNGVERKLKKFPRKNKEILFVGRLVPEKGPDLYVNAIKLIASDYPNWNFGLIGSSRLGDNYVDNFSRDIIERFKKIGNQAKFYGFKDQLFVQNKMKTASIIVIPSLWKEPFGLVAAEAMSNGIAIIASNEGAMSEIIQSNGIVINDINTQKIKQNIIDLIKNKNKRIELQKKAWSNFNFDSKKSSQELDFYRNIIIKEFF